MQCSTLATLLIFQEEMSTATYDLLGDWAPLGFPLVCCSAAWDKEEKKEYGQTKPWASWKVQVL